MGLQQEFQRQILGPSDPQAHNIEVPPWASNIHLFSYKLRHTKQEKSSGLNGLKGNCMQNRSCFHLKELSCKMLKSSVSLQLAKPFSSYEGLKINKGILKPVRNIIFRIFELPNDAKNDVTVDH